MESVKVEHEIEKKLVATSNKERGNAFFISTGDWGWTLVWINELYLIPLILQFFLVLFRLLNFSVLFCTLQSNQHLSSWVIAQDARHVTIGTGLPSWGA